MEIENHVRKYIVKQHVTFLPSPPKRKDQSYCPSIDLVYKPISCCSNCQIWLATRYNTRLSHLSTNRIFFSNDRCLNRCNISFAKSWVEDCLELNFKHIAHQTLAHLSCNFYVCWTSGGATRARFLSVQASVGPSMYVFMCAYQQYLSSREGGEFSINNCVLLTFVPAD